MLQDKRTKWAGVALVVFILSYFFVSMIFDGQEERKPTKTHRSPKHPPNKAPNKPLSTPTTTTAQTAPIEEVEDLFPDGEDDTEEEYKIETTQQPVTKPEIQNVPEDDEDAVTNESSNEAATAEAEAKLAAEEDEEEDEEETQTALDSSNQKDDSSDPKGYDDDEDSLDEVQAQQGDQISSPPPPPSSNSPTNEDVSGGIEEYPEPGTEGRPEAGEPENWPAQPSYVEGSSSEGTATKPADQYAELKQEIVSDETVDDYDDDAALGRLTGKGKHEDPKVTTEVEAAVANNFPPLFKATQEGKHWAKYMTGAPFPPSLPSPPEEFPREGFMTDQEEASIAWQAEQRVSQLLDLMNRTQAIAPHFCAIPDPEDYPCPEELSPIGVPPLDTSASRFCISYYGGLTPKSVASADTSGGVFAWPLPLPDRTLIGLLSFKKLNSVRPP